jgi:TolB protein
MTELQLTHDTATDLDPVFSPDGKRIAVSSNRSGSFDIWVMNAFDGKRRMQLTTMDSDERSPKWSPDGKRIAFLVIEQGRTDIWVSSIDGEERIDLTNDGALKKHFEWSPSGELLVYDSNRGGRWNIWLADLHAHRAVQLTESQGDNMYPSWTADGKGILFSSNRLSDFFKIYAMSPDGASLRQLTSDTYIVYRDDTKPCMSPDGKYIAFVSDRGRSATLWMMNADGANLHEASSYPPMQRPGLFLEPEVASDSYPLWNSQSQGVMYWDRDSKVFMFYQNISVVGYYAPSGSIPPLSQGNSIVAMDQQNWAFEQVYASWRGDGKAIVYASNRDGTFDIWIKLLTAETPSPYG